MTALIIVLSVVLFIVLSCIIFMSVKAHVKINYDEQLHMKVRWWWFDKEVLPWEKSEKKVRSKKISDKESKDDSDDKKEKKKKENPLITFYHNQGFDGVIKLIEDVSKTLGKMFKSLLKHILVDDLLIHMEVAKGDAAETAIEYGKTCSKVFPALGAICSYVKVKNYAVNVTPVFTSEESVARFTANFSIRPIFITNALIVAAFRLFFKAVLKLLVSKKDDSSEDIEKKDQTERKENIA